MASREPVTLYKYWNPLGKAWVGARWLLTRSGPGASNQFESAAFIRSRAGVDYPDIQFHFLPIAVRYDGKAAAEGHGFQAHVGPMRSARRAAPSRCAPRPRYAAAHPFQLHERPAGLGRFPQLHPADPRDLRPAGLCALSFGMKSSPARRRNPMPTSMRSSATMPKAPITPAAPAGWAAADDPMAVVDPECRVIGVDGLRVADSSIFPRITNGNLNAPSILVGEKAADHILGRTPLPPANDRPWINPDWQTRQR
jgi:choline dehydrogenase